VSITGRIVFTDPRAAGAVTPGTVRLSAQPKNPLDFLPMAGGQGRVGDDFTFEIKARPANVVVRANVMPGASGSWALRSVKWNGVDVTDGGIDLKAGEDVSGLEVEITNRLTEISGLVANARGETVKDYSLVIFARDRERWGPGSRFVRTGRPDQDGRFKISGLPPGSYYAVALDYFDPADDASDPEFLDRIRDRATAVSVIDGETKTIDLKLTAAS
jgi:hypothetical protein